MPSNKKKKRAKAKAKPTENEFEDWEKPSDPSVTSIFVPFETVRERNKREFNARKHVVSAADWRQSAPPVQPTLEDDDGNLVCVAHRREVCQVRCDSFFGCDYSLLLSGVLRRSAACQSNGKIKHCVSLYFATLTARILRSV